MFIEHLRLTIDISGTSEMCDSSLHVLYPSCKNRGNIYGKEQKVAQGAEIYFGNVAKIPLHFRTPDFMIWSGVQNFTPPI